MPQVLCGSHLKMCRIRVSRLLDDCTYATGPDNSVVTNAGIRFDAQPEIEAGEEIIQKNGCGEICLNIKDPDEIKRLNLELELCTRDLDLLNILSCKTPILNEDGDTIGGCTKSGALDCPGATLEIWAKVGTDTGTCGEVGASDYQWVRYYYPKVTLLAGGVTLENGLNNLTLTGIAEGNANSLDGPFSDWETTVDSTDLECWQYETEAPPEPSCGYGAPVPADANTP